MNVIVTKVSSDVVTTHTVTIAVANAPKMPTHYYYEPDLMYTPDTLSVEWEEGKEPTGIKVFGATDKRVGLGSTDYKGGFGIPQAPQWVRTAVRESIPESASWPWGPGNRMFRGQQVQVMNGEGPGRSEADAAALAGRYGRVTGRIWGDDYLEVDIVNPLSGRKHGYLLRLDGVEAV